MSTIVLENESQMQVFAQKLAKDCKNFNKSLIIYLSGDLGAGKTTFTRYFIQAFGWEGRVKSPTYTLIETYSLQDLVIYHLDLYRINSEEEVSFLGLEEIYNNKESISIMMIEWPEKAGSFLPQADIILKFDHVDSNELARSIQIDYKNL